jgi:hypothetical protein
MANESANPIASYPVSQHWVAIFTSRDQIVCLLFLKMRKANVRDRSRMAMTSQRHVRPGSFRGHGDAEQDHDKVNDQVVTKIREIVFADSWELVSKRLLIKGIVSGCNARID